jgi:imidazolonepropionase
MTENNPLAFSTPPGEEIMTACRAYGIEQPEGAPPRKEGQGPFARLILRNAMLIDGTGAPTQGPFNIIVENDHIAEIRHALFTVPPEPGDFEIDCTDKYVLPGFIDTHVQEQQNYSGLGY